MDDLVSDARDKKHQKPFVEGKHLARWLRETHKWLEWGTNRAPSLFRRPTFPELYAHGEKLFIHRTSGNNIRCCLDTEGTLCNHTVFVCVPWFGLNGVRNNSIKKAARYKDEEPPRPDLPQREELEKTSRRFAIKYLLAVMNSSVARDFLRANRRSNTDLYPDDWKKLPIPDVDAKAQAPIVKLVDKILEAKRKNLEADISAMESDVDSLVVDLYGVTSTPIASPESDHRSLPAHSMKGHSIAEKDMKEYLRTECLPALGAKYKYVSIDTIRDFLKGQRKSPTGATLKLYLSELMAGSFIHSAGKGWYSFIKEPFQLDPEPTSDLVQLLEQKYPLLDFACWSTAQIKHFTHQTLAKFVSFVYVEKHNRSAVFETLRDAGFNAYMDPSKTEAERIFSIRDKTVVVRPSIAGQPVKGKLATIEKILVDLYAECVALPIMDVAEYRRTFSNLVHKRRIMVSAMAMYAERRKISISNLMEEGEYTIST